MVEVAIASLAAVLPEEERVRMGLPAKETEEQTEKSEEAAETQAAAAVSAE